MTLTEDQKKKIEEEEKYRHQVKSTLHPGNKNKIVAALLAFFLGGFGIHKFYLGRVGWGILYLLFCWTFIPSFVSLIEAIYYLVMSDGNFNKKYN